MKKEELKEVFDVKIGEKICVDRRWYKITAAPNGKSKKWQLETTVGSWGASRTITIHLTAAEITRHHFDRKAEETWNRGHDATKKRTLAESFEKKAYEFRKKLLASRARLKAKRNQERQHQHQLPA